MKNLMLLASILLVASCTQPGGPSELDERNQANRDVVFGFIDAVATGNIDGIASALADDFIGYGPAVADSVTKEEYVATWQSNWDSLVTSIAYERIGTGTENPTEGPNQGDWVMDWANVTANYQDGTSATFLFNGVFKVADGKVVRSAFIYNVADLLIQRGFKIVPPSADEETTEEEEGA